MAALIIVAVYWCWPERHFPPYRMPDWTPAEREAIKEIHKKHGAYTLIRTAEGIYFQRDGETVWIER
jgi:hypothetical protein